MPNEQTTVPLFVAAEVLTAADMNLSAGTGVPVFANTTTRDAGFGGAGEKVLAEGQLCYLSDSNIVQYYSGASWATVGPASAGGLVCVKAETAFTGSTSIVADNVFTSSYTNYVLLFSTIATGGATLSLRLRVGGVSAATNYHFQTLYAASTTVTASRLTAQTSLQFGYATGAFISTNQVVFYGPQVASPTVVYNQHNHNGGSSYTAPELQSISGSHSTATSYDGLEILSTSGLTGTYAIYGYAKTV